MNCQEVSGFEMTPPPRKETPAEWEKWEVYYSRQRRLRSGVCLPHSSYSHPSLVEDCQE